MDPFPRLDDHLVEPEVTRDEIVGGVRVVASPVEAPHATQQSQLGYLLRAHAIPGYRVAMELLTRFDQGSDFATDVCVVRDGLDPATGYHYLEKIAFEVMFKQSEDLVKEARGRADSLLKVLEMRGIAVNPAQRQAILNCP